MHWNYLILTSQTGDHLYSDTSPTAMFSGPGHESQWRQLFNLSKGFLRKTHFFFKVKDQKNKNKETQFIDRAAVTSQIILLCWESSHSTYNKQAWSQLSSARVLVVST